jgi:hypothetical protein
LGSWYPSSLGTTNFGNSFGSYPSSFGTNFGNSFGSSSLGTSSLGSIGSLSPYSGSLSSSAPLASPWVGTASQPGYLA